jgi:hypothetical protein
MSEIYNHRQIEDINNVNQELQNADNLQQLHGFQNVNVLMQNRENQAARGPLVSQNKWNERRKILLTNSINNQVVKHYPEKSAFSENYNSTFKSRLTDAKRAEKSRDKSSRLNQKRKNREGLMITSNSMTKVSLERLYDSIRRDQQIPDRDELFDLAAFVSDNKQENAQLINNFLGEGEEQKEMDKNAALDQMLTMILSYNLGDIRLDNDKEIVSHVNTLEGMSRKICAFDRLAAKYKYFEQMDADTKQQINDKLVKVRAVANYYLIRKDIITDPLYRTHYNDELSFDASKAKSPEEMALSMKLINAYAAGKYLLHVNGASAKTVKNLGTPKFFGTTTGKQYLKLFTVQLQSGSKKIIAEKYGESIPVSKIAELEKKLILKKDSEKAVKELYQQQEEKSVNIASNPDAMDEALIKQTNDQEYAKLEDETNAEIDYKVLKALDLDKEVGEYTTSKYKYFNSFLRNPQEEIGENMKKQALKLKRELNRCKMARNVVVSRGVEDLGCILTMLGIKNKPDKPEDIIKEVKKFVNNPANQEKDIILTDPGFVSTCYSAKNDFATKDVGIEFVIKVNKGTCGANIKKNSKYPDEKEILLNAGTKFRLIKIYNSSDEEIEGLEYRKPSYEKATGEKKTRKHFLKVYLETIPQKDEGIIRAG